MKTEKIRRIVLVGVGGFGRTWVHLLATDPTFAVVGLVDLQEDAIAEARSALNLGESAVFPDLETALDTMRPDLVVDSTPPRYRLRWAKIAFAHGAHMIVAKPLAERLSEGLEMVRLAEESGRYLAINQQQRYHIVARTLARYIREGRRIYTGRIDDQYIALGKWRPRPTRHDLEEVLEAVTTGQPLEPTMTEAVGCAISPRATSN